jgi:hypothetical protein
MGSSVSSAEFFALFVSFVAYSYRRFRRSGVSPLIGARGGTTKDAKNTKGADSGISAVSTGRPPPPRKPRGDTKKSSGCDAVSIFSLGLPVASDQRIANIITMRDWRAAPVASRILVGWLLINTA